MSGKGRFWGWPFEMTEAKVRARPSWQPLILGCGGGQNTAGLLAELKFRGIRPDALVMADTAGRDPERIGELPETYEWLEKQLQPWLKRNDFPALVMVHNASPRSGHLSLYDECVKNGVLPGASYGNKGCTVKWKVQPMEKWVRSWAGAEACYAASSRPVKMIGYDAGSRDEERSEKSGDGDRWHSFWYPLQEWGMNRPACQRACIREGLALPPGSMCFDCVARPPADVLKMRSAHPRLFDLGVALEENAMARGGIGGRDAAAFRQANAAQISMWESIEVPIAKEGVVGLGRSWSWKGLADMQARDLEKLVRLEAARERPGCFVCAVDAPENCA